MNSREVFPDEELRRRIMDFIMAAGQTLLENGAEVFRVEQTMEIMARSFHLREFHVYVLTNGIFASAGTAEISEVRNVPTRTTHLGRVAAVNALSREIAEGSMSLDEAESRLVLARRIPFPKNWVQLVSGMCGAFCFALISAAHCAVHWRRHWQAFLPAAICCCVSSTSCPAAFARSAVLRLSRWCAFWPAECWAHRPVILLLVR